MKIAESMSVGRLAPKHSLNIDGIRAISKNVTPSLIKNDVILIDRLKGQGGKYMTISPEITKSWTCSVRYADALSK